MKKDKVKIIYLIGLMGIILGVSIILFTYLILPKLMKQDIEKGVCILKTDQYISSIENKTNFNLFIFDTEKFIDENKLSEVKWQLYGVDNGKSVVINCKAKMIFRNSYYTTFEVEGEANEEEFNELIELSQLEIITKSRSIKLDIGSIKLQRIDGVYCDNTGIDIGVYTSRIRDNYFDYVVENKTKHNIYVKLKPYEKNAVKIKAGEYRDVSVSLDNNHNNPYIILKPYFEITAEGEKSVTYYVSKSVTSYFDGYNGEQTIDYINKELKEMELK